MKELLDQNREKIGETAYKKAYTAATQLENLYVAVPVELLAVIAYIFSALHEVTPLTLQKLLYYIQGNYAAIYDKPLFVPPAKRGCTARCIAMSIICSGTLSTTPLTMTALCR